jgi:epoxyqueuosine reductase
MTAFFASRGLLTYHNEAVRDFPEWIDPSWHHCLVGCMRCQTICQNRMVRDWFEPGRDSPKETAMFIGRTPREHLPEETIARLKNLENPTRITGPFAGICR